VGTVRASGGDLGGDLGGGSETLLTQPTPFRKSKRACSVNDNETWVLANSANTLNNFDLGDTRTTHAVVQHQMPGSVAPTIGASGPPYSRTGNERVEAEALAVTYDMKQHHNPQPSQTVQLTTMNCSFVRGDTPLIQPAMAVRRLTPVECERLQGFPDNWSRISWKGKPEEDCPDGPRYKACGNSMAVPCMFWIGNRIAQHEAKA
jgi:site-specific DNA-cytosine methylase